MDDLRSLEHSFHGKFHRRVGETFAEGGFAKFGVAAENAKMESAEFLRSETKGGDDFQGFSGAGLAAGDGENDDGRHARGLFDAQTGKGLGMRDRWLGRSREIGADREEGSFFERAGKPGEFFRGDRKDGEVGEVNGAAHGTELCKAANAIGEARAGIGLDIMKNDSDASASGCENAQRLNETKRKAASGPGESRVLNEDPRVAPTGSLQLQRLERMRPAMEFPGNAANFELEVVRSEGFAEVSAVILDGVGGFVAASKKGEDAPAHGLLREDAERAS